MTTNQIQIIPADADIEQLRKMASLMGLDFHHRAGEAKLRALIESHTVFTPAIAQPEANSPEQAMAEMREKVEHHNTPEQVVERVEAFLNARAASPAGKRRGFKAEDFLIKFPRDEFGEPDGSWIFRYRKGGLEDGRGVWREESGNLNIPMKRILEKAENVSNGPLTLMGHRPADFEGGTTGKYSDIVMM